jgi:hypothetical protein
MLDYLDNANTATVAKVWFSTISIQPLHNINMHFKIYGQTSRDMRRLGEGGLGLNLLSNCYCNT